MGDYLDGKMGHSILSLPDYFYINDGHPKPVGYTIMARGIEEELGRLGLLPKPRSSSSR
jgi:hypothetical protein